MIVTLTIPDDSADSISAALGWPTEVRNPDHDTMYPDDTPETIPNPETQQEFLKKSLCSRIEYLVRQHKLSLEGDRLSDTLHEELNIT